MKREERAKIFAPYAALTGFGEVILASEEEREERVLLGEGAQRELDEALRSFCRGDLVRLRCYRDGHYVTLTGVFRGRDPLSGALRLDGTELPPADLLWAERI